ncbi:MAG: hypothetical protein QXJ77_01700 [Candidatus Bathyarchaeia archaeon]
MNKGVVVLGFLVAVVGGLALGFIAVFVGFVTVLVGLLMESVEDVKRELRVCRICGRKISKWQAESLGLCQKCFEKTMLAEKED